MASAANRATLCGSPAALANINTYVPLIDTAAALLLGTIKVATRGRHIRYGDLRLAALRRTEADSYVQGNSARRHSPR